MAWTLEIHHLDVGQGDSTLIIARGQDNNRNAVVRSMLIDGGRHNKGDEISDYLQNV